MTMGGYVIQKRLTSRPETKKLNKRVKKPAETGDIPDRTIIQNSAGLPSFSYYDNDLRAQESTYSYRNNGRTEDQTAATILNSARESGSKNTYDTGHEFWSEKKWMTTSHEKVILRSTTGAVVTGPLYVGGYATNANNPLVVPAFNSNYYGNKAIASCAPTVPNANFSVTAAELIRERITLPGMAGWAQWLKSRSSFGRSLGSEWLNVQFGLVPVMADAQKLFVSMLNMQKSIEQLIRDDGRIVRRRYSFPPLRSTTRTTYGRTGEVHLIQNGSDISGGAWAGLYAPPSSDRRSAGARTTTSYERYWFSGAFTYKIPVDDSIIGRLRRYEFFLQKLAGTRLTPEVLWELTPWSWLVDWFADVQSFVKATGLLQSDGLVVKYGYLMRTTVLTRTDTLDGFYFNNPSGYQNGTAVSSTYHLKRVERARSTPFGFGLNPNAFSARQWAILAALGLTKAPQTLF